MRETTVTNRNPVPGCVEAPAYSDRWDLPLSPHIIAPEPPAACGGRLAAVISTFGSPPVMVCTALLLTALKLSSSAAWKWAGIYLILGVLTPFLYVVWLLKRGYVTDIDVQLRKQRAQPLLVTILCTGAAWLVLALGAAPTTMTLIATAIWLQVVVIFAVTLRWKISVQAATVAGAMTVAWALLGSPLPFLIAVPLVAWSRVRLRRHTLLQTLAGVVLGLVIFWLVSTLAPSG